MYEFNSKPGGNMGVKNMVLQFMGIVFSAISLAKSVYIEAYGHQGMIITSFSLLAIGILLFTLGKGYKHIQNINEAYQKHVKILIVIALLIYTIYIVFI